MKYNHFLASKKGYISAKSNSRHCQNGFLNVLTGGAISVNIWHTTKGGHDAPERNHLS